TCGKLAALEPDAFDYVKVPGVSHETWDELEQAGLVETFLATGYGDVLFYRLTSAGMEALSDASS
ncbi:hypothetical protein LCGC14_2937260, partial [marine sediment metagenome]